MCSPCSGRLGGCLAVTDAGCAIDVDSGTIIDVVAAVDEYRIPAVLQTELPMQIRSHGIFMVVMNTNRMFQLRRKGIQHLLLLLTVRSTSLNPPSIISISEKPKLS